MAIQNQRSQLGIHWIAIYEEEKLIGEIIGAELAKIDKELAELDRKRIGIAEIIDSMED